VINARSAAVLFSAFLVTGAAPPTASSPAAGDVTAELSDGRLSLRSTGARLGRVLQELGRAGGFRVVTGRVELRTVDLRFGDKEPEDALRHLLGGVRYGLRYEVLPGTRDHVLALVFVGEFEEGQKSQRREVALARWRRERARAAWEQERSGGVRRDALSDPDPGVRAQAVRRLRTDRARLWRLGEILARDPDPEVRLEAARRLGQAEPGLAVPPLVPGLRDPDSEVVVAVIDALSFVGDLSVVPDLRRLLQHPDPPVRERAGRVLELLDGPSPAPD
jgi:hypothetical protein